MASFSRANRGKAASRFGSYRPDESAALELRIAALGQRAGALDEVLGSEQRALRERLELHEGHFVQPIAAVDDFLGKSDGERRITSHLARELLGGGDMLACGDHAIDQTDARGLLGID